MAEWLPAVLIGLAFALLILYFVRTRPKVETYVQEPVHKGSPIDDENELLIAVGLQTRYVAAPSVMDKSEISTEDWIKAQARGGIAPGPAAAGGMVVQTMVSTPSGAVVSAPWTGGGVSSGAAGGAPVQSSGVMVPGKAIDELVTPGQVAMAAAAAPGPAPLTAAQMAAQAQADRDANFIKQQQADALVKDATLKQAQQAAVAALKDSYVNDFQNRWLTSNDNRTNPKLTQDTPATRTAFVAWLQSKYDMDKLSFDTTMNPTESDPVKIQIRNDALAVFDNRKAAIAMLDSTWQSNSTVDCFVVPWANTTTNNIADLPTNNYEVAVDCTAECGWGTMKARATYQGPSGSPPGAACPPVSSRVTKNFNCKKAECIQTRSPATASCAYNVGYEYAAADNQCVKPLTDINWTMAANGCPPPWTYDANATATYGGVAGIGATTVQGACKQSGRTNIAVSCAAGYKWNSTRKRCEIDPPMTPTWSCSDSSATLTNALKPDCVGQGPDPNKKGTPYLKT